MEQNTKIHNHNMCHNLGLHIHFCRTSPLGAFVPWEKRKKYIGDVTELVNKYAMTYKNLQHF